MEFNVIKRRLPKSLDERLFSRLSILSIFAMLAVAGTMIFSQVLIQTRIGNQNLDSKIINLAGRQRMLSQKLSKECFILGELPATQRNPVLTMARSTLETLSEAHEALKSRQGSLELYGKNSPFIQEKFTHLQFPFDGLTQSADSMLRLIEQQPGVPNEALLPLVQRIRPLEADFLTQMDEIVFLYEREAKQRLDDLRQTELLLFVSALLILGSILVFILLPNNRMVTNTVKSLIQKEEEAQRLNRDINRLFSSLEASHKELSNLNDMLDEAALFCSTNLDGEIIHFSKNFQELFSLQTPPQDQKFQDFLSLSSAEIEQLGNCFQLALTEGKCSQEIVLQQIGPQPIWLEVNMFRYGPEGQPEVFVLCNNTTEQKIAQAEVERLHEERLLKTLTAQRQNAALLLSAQEDERRRIARDIHDGIGQMLTALKFNLEALPTDNQVVKENQKSELKQLTRNIIRDLRQVTFNLMPNALGDYGISSGLDTLCEEMGKRVDVQITFSNLTQFHDRLPDLVETNLFRIVQEALNNAIKYAEADHIRISLSHDAERLKILIEDDGKGFDSLSEEKNQKRSFGSGMGLMNMQERVEFIRGIFYLDSAIGKGTRIEIDLPLNEFTE